MSKKIWTKEKIDVLKMYLDVGATYGEIAQKLGLTYDQVEHTVRRYRLKPKTITINPNKVKPKDRDKIIISSLKNKLSNVVPYPPSKQDKLDKKAKQVIEEAEKINKESDELLDRTEGLFEWIK
ncbi:hypothetical protein LCGC14_2890810 [marine sediment metagenome]|uniref:Uncharacterized protein n=1 Tax=marine sediment metagenome TaxID=412755 RepID=A0A0F8VYK5_9ZZZZ